MPAQTGSGWAARSTSRGTPASPGEFTTTSRLIPWKCSFSGSSRCRASASAVAQQAGPMVGVLIDPADEGRPFGESLLDGFERGGLAGEGTILALEELLQIE